MSPHPEEIQLPVYLDYNATTPVDPCVLEKIVSVLKDDFGNPSSQHHILGHRASEILEQARAQVARLIHCSPAEIVFTSGATESCNLAIRGAAEIVKDRGNHIITCMTEHKAVLWPCKVLAACGFEVSFLRPDICGRVDPQSVANAITENTILVCIMMANNVTGTINPIAEIAEICKKRGILFFSDATQAVGKIPFDVEQLKLDMAAFSSHKICGAKGTGVLYIRNKAPRVRISPLILGGGQERGLRSGTENVAGIAVMGMACELAGALLKEEQITLADLRNRLEDGLLSRIPGAQIIAWQGDRLPNTTNISFPGIGAERLLKEIPQIAASTGSACDSSTGDSNYVLSAMGIEEDVAAGAIRFSVGRFTTLQQIDYAIEIIANTVSIH
jgi:cysteine desulfurase